MPPLLRLTIPQPCSKSWAAMMPTAAGRHCAACAAEVVDFTQQTDAEILAHLAKAAGRRTCGRFAAGQLDRPLQHAAPAAPTARWRAMLAAAVAVWGLRETAGTEAQAQAPIEMRKMGETAAVPEHLRAASKSVVENTIEAQLIRGVVRDSSTHEGLPGVTVLIKNALIGVSTNYDGTFELSIPREYVHSGAVELRVSYVGYLTEERLVVLSTGVPKLEVVLQQDVKGLGEVVIVGGYGVSALPPAPWHPRRFYNWGKYWLMRPFRRS